MGAEAAGLRGDLAGCQECMTKLGSHRTRRWREADSNFRFRVRCKRRLKAKIGGFGSMPPSIICGLPSVAISSGAK